MKKIIALLFVCLFTASLCACGGDSQGQTSSSSNVLSWQDLKTADQIEEKNTVDPKFLNDAELYDRTEFNSRLSERPFQDHLSLFLMREYPIEGKYLMQTGESEQSSGTTIKRAEWQFPEDLIYQLRLSDDYSIQRISYTNDITESDPEYAEEFGFDLITTQDQIAVVNDNDPSDMIHLLGASTNLIAYDCYGYVYQTDGINYLVLENLYYQNNPFIVNQDTLSSVDVYNLDKLNEAQGSSTDAYVCNVTFYLSDAYETRITMSTTDAGQLLYSDYNNVFSYYNEDAVYDSIRDAENYIDDYLNGINITRKIYDFQTDKDQELKKIIPLLMYRWIADQDMLETFNNTEMIPGVTQESPAEFSLIFGHQ